MPQKKHSRVLTQDRVVTCYDTFYDTMCVFKNLTWPVVYIHSEHVGKLYTCKLTWWMIKKTVEGERFAGLNIHGVRTIEVFMEIFSRCLGHKYSLFSIIQERHLYSRKHFRGTPVNREKCESLAQWIFPGLWYNEVLNSHWLRMSIDDWDNK